MNRTIRSVLVLLLAVPFLFLLGEGWDLAFLKTPRLQKRMERLSIVSYDLFSIQKNLLFLLSETGRALDPAQVRGYLAQIDSCRMDIAYRGSVLSSGQRRTLEKFSHLPEIRNGRGPFFLRLSTLLDVSVDLLKSVEELRKDSTLEAARANSRLNRIALWLSLLFAGSLGASGIWISQNLTIHKLSEFNTLLTKVNQVVASAGGESDLIQAICDLAVHHGHLSLAWIGRPDDLGFFRILGVSGVAEYLEGARISVDPSSAGGQGPVALAWRNDRPCYIQSLVESKIPPDWKNRARRFGLEAVAALPIHRGGAIWGVFTVYHRRRNMFDAGLQNLLEELATDISRGFDRMDTLHRQEILSSAMASVGEGVFICDAQKRIVYVNDAFTALTGYASSEMSGEDACHVLHCFSDSGAKSRIAEALDSGSGYQGEILSERKDGSRFWLLLTVNPVRGGGERVVRFVGVMRNITAIHDLSERMGFQASHDVLTGLPNRRALQAHLSRAISLASRNGTALAVGMFDLDDFKPVNDNFGHEAGDRLLRDLAGRLMSDIRESDFLARLGGDEFVVVIENLDVQNPLLKLEPLLERLHRAVEPPFDLAEGRTVSVNLSLGIALYPLDGNTGDLLLREADAAMFQVKEKKHERLSWWQRGSRPPSQPPAEKAFDPYGPETAALLDRAGPWIESVIGIFLAEFFELLARNAEQAAILSALDEEERQKLRVVLARHLTFLFRSSTNRKMILAQGKRVGKTHTLVGVRGPYLLQSKGLFDRILIENMNRSLLPARERYRMLLIAEARLGEDIQEQLRTEIAITGAYFDILSHPLPKEDAQWKTACKRELVILGSLPGILSAVLLGPEGEKSFAVLSVAGLRGTDFAKLLQAPGREKGADPAFLRSLESFNQAMEGGRIFSASSVDRDPRFAFLAEAARKTGIRSLLFIPVRNGSEEPIAVVCLAGSFPNMFEALWMQQFSHGLGERWTQIYSQMAHGIGETRRGEK
ncbi:MAG: diguanylate cyclase [Nitrospirae bacterium]|nr:diguanylate cyclase [Nitrospirota bacterium]MCL5286079.1 diguanylate cyclase [Nitrospirota bacterium]